MRILVEMNGPLVVG